MNTLYVKIELHLNNKMLQQVILKVIPDLSKKIFTKQGFIKKHLYQSSFFKLR